MRRTCTYCSSPPDCGYRTCLRCRIRTNVATKKWQGARIERGECRSCGKLSDRGQGKKCSPCVNSFSSRRRSHIEKGFCSSGATCKERALSGITQCQRHWMMSVARNHKVERHMLERIWDRQNGLCVLTGDDLVPGRNASLDHEIPKSLGGESSEENLRWVTTSVNGFRGTHSDGELLILCEKVVKTLGRISSSP